jgi:anti-sigma regulatory factor (Ser/Thr protein kinase)
MTFDSHEQWQGLQADWLAAYGFDRRSDEASALPFRAAPAVPPVPSDPAVPHQYRDDRWPLRSYLQLVAMGTAPRLARQHARAVLREWAADHLDADAGLVLSELVTNALLAVQAASRPEPVRLWMLGHAETEVILLVWDAAGPVPVRSAPDPGSEHGRGLVLVEALAARWGHYRPAGQQRGKVVWAALSLAIAS